MKKTGLQNISFIGKLKILNVQHQKKNITIVMGVSDKNEQRLWNKLSYSYACSQQIWKNHKGRE